MSLLNLKQISPLGATVGSVIVNEGTTRVWSISSTTGIKIPSGTTAHRPASPPLAILRYNTDTSSYEYWDGSTWGTLGGGPSTLAYTSVTDGTTTHTAAPGQQSITVVGNTGISGVVTAAPSAIITIGMNIPSLTVTSPFVVNNTNFIPYYDGTLNAHRRVSAQDLLEGYARTYRTTFVAGDLDTNDNLTVNHNLNLSEFTVGVHVYNQLNRLVIPTYVEFVNANQIIINFTGHGVTGTWRVLVIG